VESEPGVAILALESSSHPDGEAWYPNKNVELSWVQLEGDSPINAYYYSFSTQSDAEPNIYLDGETTSLSLDAPNDGIYYFRLKGVQEDGRETTVLGGVVRVDTTAPNAIELTVQDDKILVGESAWFTFATTDETSGVLQYQVAINDSAFQVQTSPLEMEDLPEGTYFFRVAAFDRAGNVTGLVDFDRALWGDVEIEFAVLDYCGISEPAFWEGYGTVRDESPSARVRRQFYLLYELQKYMPIRVWRRNDPAGAARYREECLRLAMSLFR